MTDEVLKLAVSRSDGYRILAFEIRGQDIVMTFACTEGLKRDIERWLTGGFLVYERETGNHRPRRAKPGTEGFVDDVLRRLTVCGFSIGPE